MWRAHNKYIPTRCHRKRPNYINNRWTTMSMIIITVLNTTFAHDYNDDIDEWVWIICVGVKFIFQHKFNTRQLVIAYPRHSWPRFLWCIYEQKYFGLQICIQTSFCDIYHRTMHFFDLPLILGACTAYTIVYVSVLKLKSEPGNDLIRFDFLR